MAITTLPATGLKALYDASIGLKQSSGGSASGNGDPVGEWADQSGNGFHVTQATAGAKPTLRTAPSEFYGKPAVEFDGGDWLERTISGALLADDSAFCIYVVFASSGTGAYALAAEGRSSTNTVSHLMTRINSTTAGSVGFLFRDDVNASNQVNSGNVSANNGAYHVYCLRRVASNDFRVYLDGVQQVTASSSVGTTTIDRFAIGALVRNTVANQYVGKIALVALYEADNFASVPALIDSYFKDQPVSLTGIASAEGLGALTVTPGAVTVSLTGIASAEGLGSISLAQNVSLTGIASAEGLGALTVTPGDVTVTLDGIPSGEALGDLTLTQTVELSGIASGEQLGDLTITPGDVAVSLTGIASAEGLGALTVTPGDVAVSLTGIASAEGLGALTVTPGAVTVSLTGIASAEGLGALTVTPGDVAVSLTGIASAEGLGALTVTPGDVTVTLDGIASAEALGDITVAADDAELPAVISAAAFPTNNSYPGPFLSSAGDVYFILPTAADKSLLGAWKADGTSPASGFTEMDAANHPDLSLDIAAVWAYQVGDVLHIATIITTDYYVDYHTFDMSSDEWDVVSEEIEHTVGTFPARPAVSIMVRTSGEVCVAYNNTDDVIVARRTGVATWSNSIIANGANEFTLGVIIRGAVNGTGEPERAHVLYSNNSLDDGFHRALSGAFGNSLQTAAAFDTSISNITYAVVSGVSFDDAGTIRVRGAYRDSTSNRASVVKFDSANTPTMTTDALITASGVAVSGAGAAIMSLSVDPSTLYLYLLFADSTSNDLYIVANTGGTWGTETEILDGVTINAVSSAVYTRDSTLVLGYVYDDGGTVKYGEYEFPVAVGLTGIASAEALGAITVTPGAVSVSLTGIPSGEALGSISLTQNVSLTGIPSGEQLGALTVTADAVTVTLSGIASGEQLGALTITPGDVAVSLSGIPSGEALGSISLTQNVSLTGIPSGEALGDLTLTQTIELSGIPSGEQLGALTVTTDAVTVTLDGIPSGEALGSISLTQNVSLTGIPSGEQLGALTVTPGDVAISLTGIPSGEQLGAIHVSEVGTPGSAVISLDGVYAASIHVGTVYGAELTVSLIDDGENPAAALTLELVGGASVTVQVVNNAVISVTIVD